MTRRITWLVAATTSAVVLAFVVPLLVLVADLAEDRAVGLAQEQARSTATLVATVDDDGRLARALVTAASQGPPVAVVRPDDRVLGRVSARGAAPGADAPPLDDAAHDHVLGAREQQAAFTAESGAGVDAVVPVAMPEGVSVVVARVPPEELRRGVVQASALVLALGVVLVGGSVLAARSLGRRISVPVTEVADVAQRLRAGDASARAVPGGPSETAELGRSLNALADRIHELVAAERELVADLGHRLRTPVTALRLDADLVEDRELAARLQRHVDTLSAGIDEVVDEARRPVRTELVQHTDVAAVVAARVAFWQALAEDQERTFVLSQDGAAAVVAMPQSAVEELLDVLLDNVFAHTPDGTDARITTVRSASRAVLVVEDAGPGLVHPWSGRGDSRGGSTGLGLDIVHRIAVDAGGAVDLGRSDLGGLRVQVSVPTAR
ncbi:HAMP domain-containing histidine kinase [Phycicoccus sp. BSK3Z-2]|uniref:histidine kinase n=1 Tax=Phycicoccus avicenniae TaxID=2828860 RepID=A0A941D9P1_9MICO|nr:HAMP domain-containing sensor histidine kinase [Phycicoccus avicenniae]MBR7744325.1 HAMP domain-containing histidine kinase [Phycicoccus avicenniae]